MVAETAAARQMDAAKVELDAFRATRDPERLENAVRCLEQADLFEPPVHERLAARRELARAWLQTLGAIAAAKSPAFDPEDRPRRRVTPPPSPHVAHIPGTAPKQIADPVVRAEYEQAIAKNRQKSADYHLQSTVRRIETRAKEGLDRFVERFYTSAPADQEELASMREECSKR